MLTNSTEGSEKKGDSSLEEGSGSGIVDVRAAESGEMLTTSEETRIEEASTTSSREEKSDETTEKTTTTISSQNSTEQEDPFDGEDAIFDVTERSKKRGEGGVEKKKKGMAIYLGGYRNPVQTVRS